jgi:hypothetical protein
MITAYGSYIMKAAVKLLKKNIFKNSIFAKEEN